MDLITLAAAKKGSNGGGGGTLTPATDTKLGGVKVGDGLSIDNTGVLSASNSKTIITLIKDASDEYWNRYYTQCNGTDITAQELKQKLVQGEDIVWLYDTYDNLERPIVYCFPGYS